MQLPDKEQFNFKDCVIAGDECWLITPKDMSVKWTDENARFRSCIVRKSDNFVVSQGFGKFTNFGERPDFQPWDKSWEIEARHKLDDTLLIVSKYKGELIIRTRGTIDARQMPNGHEIDLLMKKYPRAFKVPALDCGANLLFAWTTPSNIIVLREHDEPTLTLVGCVYSNTMSGTTIPCDKADYLDQYGLDMWAYLMGVGRPQKYEYDTIEDCILDVTAWRGKEGVVLYSPDGQIFKKIKASEYCELHKLATGMRSLSNVLDVFIASPKFYNYQDFYNYVEQTIDFEVAEKIKDDMGLITEAYGKFVHTVDVLKRDIDDNISKMGTRKEQALYIQKHYGAYACFIPVAFHLLDKKEIDDKLIHKTMEKLLNL